MLSQGVVADAAANAAVLVHTALASLRVQNAANGSSHHKELQQHLVVELGKQEAPSTRCSSTSPKGC